MRLCITVIPHSDPHSGRVPPVMPKGKVTQKC